MMELIEFYKTYIPALEKALNYVNKVDFEFRGPDSFIDDETIRNNLDKFESENYHKHEKLFNMVSNYLDAKSHNFKVIQGKDIEDYKKELIDEINNIKKKYF
ncbi:hypothetical protein [Flavobacterium sp.]|uniref:hypothetical protein n=1 Tax=Flavobacterium sp. TaxID=239 RepID=UPI00286A2FA7|nr:hypothetical protein [Flavobacterium sp.]